MSTANRRSRPVKALSRHLLEEAARIGRDAPLPAPPKAGWLRSIREALGMPRQALAARLGITQEGVRKLEEAEAAGTISLESLRRVANALGCRVQYSVVTPKPLQQMLEDRALEVASRQLDLVGHTMKLEGQEVSRQRTQEQARMLADELLDGSLSALWR